MNDKDNRRGFSALSDLTSDSQAIPQAQSQASPQPPAPQNPEFDYDIVELTKGPILPAQAGRGFSSLSDLTSDIQAISLDQSQASLEPSAPQKQAFALMELTKWPNLPAPWSSVDAGETWVWGEFFLTFQKNPKTVLDLFMEMQGKKADYRAMTYHYAMSVFYRIDKTPHGPSHLPIMTVALEQAEEGSKMGPLMIDLFTSETRLNLGEYKDNSSPQAVKERFFEILRFLVVSDQPKMIGDLAQAHGHPETGLPAKKKNSGCIPIREITKSFFGCLRVSYLCPNCSERLRSPLTDAGKPDHCPNCGTQFVVPGSNELQREIQRKNNERIQ